MYVPPLFDEQRPELLHGLIQANPLGTVVTHGAGGLDAVHLPFEIEAPTEEAPFGILRAHVSRNNPLWRQDGDAALVLFQGPSAYIAPSLYENKAISGKVVPTYNYATVHAHGIVRAVDDPVWLLAMLDRMTARHEGKRAAPWSVHDAPREYVEKLLEQIVGIEIRVERMHGIFKLSQNRSAKDRETIAGDMESRTETSGVADLMETAAR
jgi:transcriptional regulator